jgi:hypothetical protein
MVSRKNERAVSGAVRGPTGPYHRDTKPVPLRKKEALRTSELKKNKKVLLPSAKTRDDRKHSELRAM